MYLTHQLLVTAVVSLVVPERAPSQESIQLPSFNAIEIRNGAHAVLRPAQTQRVTLVKGSLDYTRIVVTGGVLVIDKCRVKCPRGYVLEVEILTPGVSRISFANGGWIQSQGSFAPQTNLAADVSHGGTIDVRSMAADRVTASVQQGGRILTVPRGSLFASVAQGGAITYWGDAQVKSSIQHGGVVSKGSTDEIHVPLSELGPPLQPPPGSMHPARHKEKRLPRR